MGMFSNPLGYAGYPPGVTGTPTTLNTTVRAATLDEANAAVLDNVYISPVTADAATSLDFASPPVLGFGSTTPRPVHATTLDSTLNTLLATAAGATTISLGNVAPSGARTTTIAGGNSAQNDSVSILNGAPSANTQTFDLLGGTATGGTQVANLANGIGGSLTVNMANGVNSTAQTVNISNGASAANTTLNLMSGVGTAGAGVINLGNNTRVTTLDLCDIAPAAARTINIAGGDSAQNDTVNILAGAPSAGTQTINILSGVATGGTQVMNLGTGTSAKAINIGNTLDTIAFGQSFSQPAPSVAGASPVVNNARSGQASFTDVIANGAYGTLTITNSSITAASIVLATPSCTTANSAVTIADIVPGVGTVAIRLLNAGSSSTDVNININYTVLN